MQKMMNNPVNEQKDRYGFETKDFNGTINIYLQWFLAARRVFRACYESLS
jgi:hypothetical protein